MHLIVSSLFFFCSLAFAAGLHENDVANPVPCKPLTLIFARGFIEPGNMGVIIGPALADALKSAVSDDSVAVQGVECISILPYTDPEGAAHFVDMVELAASRCPETVIALSGYRLVSFYLLNRPEPCWLQDRSNIDNGWRNSITFWDGLCHGGSDIQPDHLTYGKDALEAAAFIKEWFET